jgi:hypothetical protein
MNIKELPLLPAFPFLNALRRGLIKGVQESWYLLTLWGIPGTELSPFPYTARLDGAHSHPLLSQPRKEAMNRASGVGGG